MDIIWLSIITLVTVILFCILRRIVSLGGFTDFLLGFIPFAGLLVDIIILDASFAGSAFLVYFFNKESGLTVPIIVTAVILLTIVFIVVKGVITLGGLLEFLLGFFPKMTSIITVLAIILSLAITFIIMWAGINCFQKGEDFYNQQFKPNGKTEKKVTLPVRTSVFNYRQS